MESQAPCFSFNILGEEPGTPPGPCLCRNLSACKPGSTTQIVLCDLVGQFCVKKSWWRALAASARIKFTADGLCRHHGSMSWRHLGLAAALLPKLHASGPKLWPSRTTRMAGAASRVLIRQCKHVPFKHSNTKFVSRVKTQKDTKSRNLLRSLVSSGQKAATSPKTLPVVGMSAFTTLLIFGFGFPNPAKQPNSPTS